MALALSRRLWTPPRSGFYQDALCQQSSPAASAPLLNFRSFWAYGRDPCTIKDAVPRMVMWWCAGRRAPLASGSRRRSRALPPTGTGLGPMSFQCALGPLPSNRRLKTGCPRCLRFLRCIPGCMLEPDQVADASVSGLLNRNWRGWVCTRRERSPRHQAFGDRSLGRPSEWHYSALAFATGRSHRNGSALGIVVSVDISYFQNSDRIETSALMDVSTAADRPCSLTGSIEVA